MKDIIKGEMKPFVFPRRFKIRKAPARKKPLLTTQQSLQYK